VLDSHVENEQQFRLGEPWIITHDNFNDIISTTSYPWLSLGFITGPVERVGFRIESVGPFDLGNELLIFEILTNGRISPRDALQESALILVQKFLCISNVASPIIQNRSRIIMGKNARPRFIKNLRNAINGKISKQAFYDLFHVGFSRFRKPLGIDLGNLDLTKATYNELRGLGFRTLGQLVERLAFDSAVLSPSLKARREKSLSSLGFYLFNLYFYGKLPTSCKNCWAS
jgi:hypothetical protein